MVLPLGGGMGMMSMTGPPPDGVLKLLTWLKVALAGLGLAVAMEFVAGFFSAGLTDLLTLAMGLLLFRDLLQLNRCLLYFTLIAGMNLFYAVLLLTALLSSAFPGSQNFLSVDCPQVEVKGHVFKCSWRTALGDAGVLLAVFFEFLCVALAYRMLSLTRLAMEERLGNNPLLNFGAGGDNMLPMYAARGPGRSRGLAGVGDGSAGGFLGGGGAGSPEGPEAPNWGPTPVGEQPRGAAGAPSSRAANASAGGGFTPFSGQPHRLDDD